MISTVLVAQPVTATDAAITQQAAGPIKEHLIIIRVHLFGELPARQLL